MKMQSHCHCLIVFLIAWSASLPGAFAEEAELPLPAERHWAYLPLAPGMLPEVKDEEWVRIPIDRFVLARLEKEEIKPSPRADLHVLIKRLYYDLIGLPPSPAEVDAFVNDDSADAYAALVKRLLASEHFGERWGRHWLDLSLIHI